MTKGRTATSCSNRPASRCTCPARARRCGSGRAVQRRQAPTIYAPTSAGRVSRPSRARPYAGRPAALDRGGLTGRAAAATEIAGGMVDTAGLENKLERPPPCPIWQLPPHEQSLRSGYFSTRRNAMRIAVSAETNAGLDAPIDGHLGRSPYFTLVEVEGGQIEAFKSSPTRTSWRMSRGRSRLYPQPGRRRHAHRRHGRPGSQLLEQMASAGDGPPVPCARRWTVSSAVSWMAGRRAATVWRMVAAMWSAMGIAKTVSRRRRNMVTETEVRRALAGVMEIQDLKRSIVELGMVRDLQVADGKVAFTLALTTLACPRFRDQITTGARQAALALDGVQAVDIALAEMTAQERGRLHGGEARRAPPRSSTTSSTSLQ